MGRLNGIIRESIPKKYQHEGHPSKRTFQALRIEVNGELDSLKNTLVKMVRGLKKGGRIAVISFHSLEDRIVKNLFNSKEKGCTCPPDFPVCVCGFKQTMKVITRKPIVAGKKELEINPRARSAKLRVAEKI